MPPVPGLASDICAFTPRRRSCSVSRNPVFIESAITSVATPAATPTTENAVTKRNTAGRYGDRRYRLATNHSNRMEGSKDTSRAVRFGSRLFANFRPKQRKENNVADRRRIGQQHRQAVDANAFSRRGRHAIAERADVVHVELLWNFIASLRDLRRKRRSCSAGSFNSEKPLAISIPAT